MSAVDEAQLIARMCQRVPVAPSPNGPGDDAAVEGQRVTSVDLMVEGIHMVRSHPPEWLGHKLLAVNLSDVGAMGAVPSGFLVTAALPGDVPVAWWDALSSGLGELARESGATLLGGDVTGSPGPIILGVTLWGHVGDAGPLLRSGGRAGDVLMLHAAQGVGRSSRGLAMWLEEAHSGWGGAAPEGRQRLAATTSGNPCLRAHLRPETSWRLGPWAVQQGATAGMDCSDGLLMDVPRLAQQSSLKIDVELGGLPDDPACGAMTPEARAAGGEDYGLLVLVPPGRREVFESAGFVALGHAEVGAGVVWRIDGEPVVPAASSFLHFAGS